MGTRRSRKQGISDPPPPFLLVLRLEMASGEALPPAGARPDHRAVRGKRWVRDPVPRPQRRALGHESDHRGCLELPDQVPRVDHHEAAGAGGLCRRSPRLSGSPVVGRLLARARVPRTKAYAFSMGRDGRWPMCFWGESIRERIARQVEYIRHWKVHHTSYENFYPPVLKHVKATWFVDPPYERQGKYYNGEALNYPALAEWCRERRGQVIVCENEGAKWLPFKPFRTARANSSRGKGRVSHEVIWTS